ncbi:type II secretion system F family protein [Kineosporia sp. J2-2]|uniref:Type II secretion system F family protein n=1 Tax=Kineosporia corallincola TaxID=2835133 RepID=A0ABS5TQ53_9ACTN|nr:type II secretion system F family protein [Kineosporia corallincola]MBT0773237.1 type II secretion system F family protein [Kineosporia corallincola]
MTSTTLIALLAGLLLLGGLTGVVAGLRRTPVPPAGPATAARPSRLHGLTPRTRQLLLAGLVAGVVAALVSGWLIALIVLPVAFAGLPWLLSAPETSLRIERLEAMEEWTRSLAGVLTVGLSLENALITALRSTPPPIRAEVATLVARLNARWPTDRALRAFADDMDDPTADLIAMNLVLAAQRRGTGLAAVLEGLSESVAADVRSRRAVEADRAKPRATARAITVITIGVLVLLTFNGSYIAPYGTAAGQLVLVLLLSLFVATLVWLRSMARGEPLPRIIGTGLDRPGGSGAGR